MATVTLHNLTKRYEKSDVPAVDGLNIDIEHGEFMVFVGPSGCGKSTALRMIAGLEEITEGGVWIGDQLVNDIHPKDRDIAMVFQNYALYPHMTVYDNIAFALQIQKQSREEIRRRVTETAQILELEPYLNRRPGQLSGGQRQRVAMGRAIVRSPAAFLMDEPLSNLDAKLRVQMRTEIAGLTRRLEVTTVYVTHDQVEAMTMADRVALMRDGVLQQIDEPNLIYNRPANTFVASFIGSPSMNIFPAGIEAAQADAIAVHVGSSSLHVPMTGENAKQGLREYLGRTVLAGIRPEDVTHPDDAVDKSSTNRLRGRAMQVEALGSDELVFFETDAKQVDYARDEEVDALEATDGDNAVCVARFRPNRNVRAGERIEAIVDTSRLHFFDLNTNAAIY